MNNKEVLFNVFKSLKQHIDFQVISVIDKIDNEVTNALEVDFVSDPLVRLLWNFRRDEI